MPKPVSPLLPRCPSALNLSPPPKTPLLPLSGVKALEVGRNGRCLGRWDILHTLSCCSGSSGRPVIGLRLQHGLDGLHQDDLGLSEFLSLLSDHGRIIRISHGFLDKPGAVSGATWLTVYESET